MNKTLKVEVELLAAFSTKMYTPVKRRQQHLFESLYVQHLRRKLNDADGRLSWNEECSALSVPAGGLTLRTEYFRLTQHQGVAGKHH